MSNNAYLNKFMKNYSDSMKEVLSQALFVTAQEVRSRAIKSIQNISPGNVVERYGQGGKKYSHVAAKKGEAPNNDTGTLVKSIAAEKVNDKKYIVIAGSNLDYVKFLEFGGWPFLFPAVESVRQDEILAKTLKKLAGNIK